MKTASNILDRLRSLHPTTTFCSTFGASKIIPKIVCNMNRLRYITFKNYQFTYLCRRYLSFGSPPEGNVTDTESTTSVNVVLSKRINLDKSGLLTQHRNVLHEQRPYNQSFSWIHQTEKYQKKLFGRYGSKSEIDPRICFPQLSVLKSQDEYKKISEPRSILFMLKQLQVDEKLMEDIKLKREENICKNMAKLELWTQELYNRNKKREADLLAVKEKKEKLIEEVRRHFGYKVDPRDERFKEVLEQKDKEEKRKDKLAKRQAKENKLLTKLTRSSE